jgi:hypothetical protein
MTTQLEDVRKEIVEIHTVFVTWFNGTTDPTSLDAQIFARMDPSMTFIPPEGVSLSIPELREGFKQAFGTNKGFRIQIRDVEIRQVLDQHIVITYTEWQRGAANSLQSQNARTSSAVLTKDQPFRWLHLQETWLPESVRAAGSFDF